MPIVRIDPPKRKRTSFFEGAKRLGAFFGNPVGTLVQSVQDIHAPTAGGTFFPTELDTETGEVTIEIPKKGKGLLGRYVPRLRPLGDALERQLEASIRAGSVVPSLSGAYRDLGQLLISQSALFPRSETTPTGQYDMAGIIPPGGFAGFAQMTQASKLALGGRMKSKRKKKSRKARKARKVAKRKTRKVAKRRVKKAGKKFVKGSAAAKAHMKRLRNMRK